MKRMLHRPLWVGLIGVIVVFLVFVLFGYASHSHGATADATLSVGPNPASPGSTVEVTGFRYAAMKKVDVYFQDRANGIVHAVTNGGGFFNVALKVPTQYIQGPCYVYALSGTTITKAPMHFARPSLTYADASTSASTSGGTAANLRPSILVHGAGFVANEPVNFALYSEARAVKVGKLTTDGNGGFRLLLNLVNAPFHSDSLLTITDRLHKTIRALPIQIAPQIQIFPTAGQAGTRVYIRGRGFNRREPVTITFQDMLIGVVHTDGIGDFFSSFLVPSSASITPSEHNVRAFGWNSRAIATASFQVEPAITVSPRIVRRNEPVSVSGSQFTPDGAVDIVLVDPAESASSVGITVGHVTASATGQFSTSFTIPLTVPEGRNYNVVSVDETTGINSSVPIFYV